MQHRTRRLLFAPLALLVLLGGRAAADPTALSATASKAPAPRSAAADAATYAHCMQLAKDHPHAAQALAATWLVHGGAHPARHCAAVALITLGKYQEGARRLQELAKAMTTAPASLRADVLDQAAQAWLLAGDPVRAYAVAGQALSMQPDDPDLLIDHAEAAASAGYLDRAVADLDRVLKAHPDRLDALIYRASAYRTLDRLNPARADIDKALAEAPHSAAALLERGNIRRLEGDSAGARSDWEEIGRVAPGSPEDMAARANLEHLASRSDLAAPAAAASKTGPP
ncbi:MAG TPA: tetratricopeptide repeat protein [Stellaceae bacterium]|nr:tetratricopeptide repeat protein [Stellaceae bacterium]